MITNDPLAPLWNIREGADNNRVLAELHTDLAERGGGFVSTTYFEILDNDLISDTGLSMRSILQSGVNAASRDIATLGTDYAHRREVARMAEVEGLLSWIQAGGEGVFMLCSLCPGKQELDGASARKMNFKQDRMMSSNVIYSIDDGRLRAEYFSLDNHDLAAHKSLLARLGLGTDCVATLDVLKEHYILPTHVDVKAVIQDVFGTQPNQFSTVHKAALSQVESINRRFFTHLDESLKKGVTSSQLGSLCLQLELDLSEGSVLTLRHARQIADVLRTQRLPHFIYEAKGVDGKVDISYESALSASSGYVHSGSCPAAAVDGVNGYSLAGLKGQSIAEQARQLEARYAGHGNCHACGSTTDLYGCGVFCYSCNKVWCQEYAVSGRQLEIEEVKRRSSSETYLIFR
ncbi:MAG: hypothetical protein AAF413_02500 [Patescibacteria group bacterium]